MEEFSRVLAANLDNAAVREQNRLGHFSFLLLEHARHSARSTYSRPDLAHRRLVLI
jgi:hypothetical protein